MDLHQRDESNDPGESLVGHDNDVGERFWVVRDCVTEIDEILSHH